MIKLFFLLVLVVIIGALAMLLSFALRVSRFINGIFGGRRPRSSQSPRGEASQQTNASSMKEKVIGDDEGEYIDFEEVK